MTYPYHNNTSISAQGIHGVGNYTTDTTPEELRDIEENHLDIDSVLHTCVSYDDRDIAAIHDDTEDGEVTLLSMYETPTEDGVAPKYLYKARSLDYRHDTLGGRLSAFMEQKNVSFPARPAYAGQTDVTFTTDFMQFMYAHYLLRPYTAIREALANDVIAQRLKRGTDQIFAFLAYAKHALMERHARYVAERELRRKAYALHIAQEKERLRMMQADTHPVAQEVQTACAMQTAYAASVKPAMNTALPHSLIETPDIAELLPETDAEYERYFGTQEQELDVTEEAQTEIAPEAPTEMPALVAVEVHERTQEVFQTPETYPAPAVTPAPKVHEESMIETDTIGLITPAIPAIDLDAWARDITSGIKNAFARLTTRTRKAVTEEARAYPVAHVPFVAEPPQARIVSQRLVTAAPAHIEDRRFPTSRSARVATAPAYSAQPMYPVAEEVMERAIPAREAFENKTQADAEIVEIDESPRIVRKPQKTILSIPLPCDPVCVDRTPQRTYRKQRSGVIAFLDGITRVNHWAVVKIMIGIWFVATILMGFLKTVGVLVV